MLIFPCVNIAAQEKVRPKDGDGIHSLLRRHKRTEAHHYREFVELNKKKLGKNNSLILGNDYVLPPIKGNSSKRNSSSTTTSSSSTSSGSTSLSKKKGREPLFGSEFANYDIVSSELAGATFYVVGGHGGPDPGAIGKMGKYELHEDEYAYDIVLRLARNLMMRGATVHIIIQDAVDGIRNEQILKNSKRETCMGQAIPLNQTARLKQRANKINELHKKTGRGYARAIFVHIDSRSKHKQTDVYFYHSSSTESKRLANTMRSTFAGKYGRHQPNRGFSGTVGERNLYVLKNTVPVGLYVELGNIQNPFDQQRIILNNNRQALANWLCEGFITDYKNYKR